MELTTHLHQVKNEGAKPPLCHMPSRHTQEKTLTFQRISYTITKKTIHIETETYP
jgi:hypothetical protein